MRKEMGANVAAYAIFISFSTVVAAPFLFGLAGVLIKVIKSIGDSIGRPSSGGGSFPLSFTGTGVTYTDFKIFAIFSLVVTSFFSASIIATIKKGDIKSGVKYIPIFMFISVALFLIADVVLNKFTGIFF